MKAARMRCLSASAFGMFWRFGSELERHDAAGDM